MNNIWEKRGCILLPDASISWLASTGPCFARFCAHNKNLIQLYISGRDNKGRSQIGVATFDLSSEKIVSIAKEPVMPLGEKGSFDENGTSYPYIVSHNGRDFLFYTGWIQGVQIPWYNDLGIAISLDGVTFQRFSRAPLPIRNDLDFIGIGSVCVIKHDNQWYMWYTRFDHWEQSEINHMGHYYNIKHAISNNGTEWKTFPDVCIDFAHEGEYSIAKPCVLWIDDRFVMWYSYRGEYYRPGLAISSDGQHWKRMDDKVGINKSASGWDSEMLCYPFVLDGGDNFYMFYSGNSYGTKGLGFARAGRKDILEMIHD